MDKHSPWHPANADRDDIKAERREMLATIDRFLVKVYGERCSQVYGGCVRCTVWAARDALNAAILE